MKTPLQNRIAWVYLVIFPIVATGCVPGPPPPPGLGFVNLGVGAIPDGLWIFFLLLFVLVVWFLVKTIRTVSNKRNEEITKSLRQIHNRLEELERQIQHIRNSIPGENHEE